MDKVMVCPQCQGRKEMPILDTDKFDKQGIVEFQNELCPLCKGKGFVLVDISELKKL